MSFNLILFNIKEIFTSNPKNILLSGGNLLIASDKFGKIVFIGKESDFKKENPNFKQKYKDVIFDAKNQVIFPGFVDSHTHLVFANDRSDEFALKAKGKTYVEIANFGGGILNSAKKLQNISEEQIYNESKKRLLQILEYGITTVEIKSGYALTTNGELKLLRVINQLKQDFPIEIVPTFLGAHAIPKEFATNKSKYIDLIINEMLPAVKSENLAEFVDVFCEEGYFSLEDTKKIFTKAKDLDFGLKIHSDEFVSLGGTELAAEMGAVSADHLEAITDNGIKKMAQNGTVATVLPITSIFSKLPFAPAKKIKNSGVTLALATDFNPGSSMSGFLPLAASIASTNLGLSVEESLVAITLNGAKAINKDKLKGSIEIGKDADLLIMDCDSWIYPIYHLAHNHTKHIFIKGHLIDFNNL